MRALITGITGQDGSYLAEFLIDKGYEVYGVIRRSSDFNTRRIDHVFDKIKLVYGDLTDGAGISSILNDIEPDEVYNLAAQSHVMVSFEQPVYTVNCDALGTLRLLEAIRSMKKKPKFYQASSSEMFGSSPPPQNEKTLFHPRSPYACAKVYSYWQTVNYREAYDIHACNGILFNHESPRRGGTFVTKKITDAVKRIKKGEQKELVLGNLDSRRDWGFAGDYVEAMWLMMQKKPDDYVIATGESHSVRDFLDLAFSCVDLDWQDYVRTDDKYIRPSEVDYLHGDASKAAIELGWRPKTTFRELVEMMVCGS